MTQTILSVWDLRRNLPEIRAGLQKGVHYVLLYRGKPIGELTPPSRATLNLTFQRKERRRFGAEQIRRNVAERRRKRVQRRPAA